MSYSETRSGTNFPRSVQLRSPNFRCRQIQCVIALFNFIHTSVNVRFQGDMPISHNTRGTAIRVEACWP